MRNRAPRFGIYTISNAPKGYTSSMTMPRAKVAIDTHEVGAQICSPLSLGPERWCRAPSKLGHLQNHQNTQWSRNQFLQRRSEQVTQATKSGRKSSWMIIGLVRRKIVWLGLDVHISVLEAPIKFRDGRFCRCFRGCGCMGRWESRGMTRVLVMSRMFLVLVKWWDRSGVACFWPYNLHR